MDWSISCLYFFYIHTCVKFYILDIYDIFFCNKIEIDHMARDYYSTISKRGVPWKSWLDPRFLWDSKLKQILKWLPLDRGYFKIYFLQKEKIC